MFDKETLLKFASCSSACRKAIQDSSDYIPVINYKLGAVYIFDFKDVNALRVIGCAKKGNFELINHELWYNDERSGIYVIRLGNGDFVEIYKDYGLAVELSERRGFVYLSCGLININTKVFDDYTHEELFLHKPYELFKPVISWIKDSRFFRFSNVKENEKFRVLFFNGYEFLIEKGDFYYVYSERDERTYPIHDYVVYEDKFICAFGGKFSCFSILTNTMPNKTRYVFGRSYVIDTEKCQVYKRKGKGMKLDKEVRYCYQGYDIFGRTLEEYDQYAVYLLETN